MKIPSLFSLLAASGAALCGCGEGPDVTPLAPVTAPKVARDVLNKANAAKGAYPLDTCVVSGEKLGSMGEPVVYDHEGTEVRFCCKNCVKDFQKDPKKYLAILEAARGNK